MRARRRPGTLERLRRAGRLVLAAVLVSGLLGGCARPAATDARPLVVATTTLLADLVGQVGGDAFRVRSLVPKGGEVHTFDPRPSDLVAISEARLIVSNGLGLDDWLATLAADVGTGASIVRLAEDLPEATYLDGSETDAHGAAEPGAGAPNPHLWLNVRYALGYVDRIEAALRTLDPASADAVARRATAYRDRLGTLDAWIRERIATVPETRRAVVSFHDALPYYAAAYGLRVVGVIVPAPGQEPSAGEVAALVTAIREAGVAAVFSEVQFDPTLAATLAAEAGARVVSDLYTDSLGDPPVDTYEGVLRWDTDRIVEALR